jgi:hypothetical protein
MEGYRDEYKSKGVCLKLFEANRNRAEPGPKGTRPQELLDAIQIVFARSATVLGDYVVWSWIVQVHKVYHYVEAVEACQSQWGGWLMIATRDCESALNCVLRRGWPEDACLATYYELCDQIENGLKL